MAVAETATARGKSASGETRAGCRASLHLVPAAMLAVFQELVGRFPGSQGKVGIAMPSVVKHGKVCTAANIDHGWIGVHGPTLVEKPLGRQVIFLNDADAAGVAEVKWGAGKGIKGTAIMLTFGTGIGTAFFVDGILLPNSELGHMQLPRHGEAVGQVLLAPVALGAQHLEPVLHRYRHVPYRLDAAKVRAMRISRDAMSAWKGITW